MGSPVLWIAKSAKIAKTIGHCRSNDCRSNKCRSNDCRSIECRSNDIIPLYVPQNNNCQFSWLNYVESILNECGLSYVWFNKYFISEQWLKNSVKNQFYQTWHANIDTGSKTLSYRLF